MYLADFHIHSNFSDGKLSIPEIVDLYGKNGFGVIAITDHLCDPQNIIGRSSVYLGYTLTESTFPLYQAILKSEQKRAWEQYEMLLIPGIELTKNTITNHHSCHILALGVTDMILPVGDPLDWVEEIHKRNGIAIAAHPVWTRKVEKQTYHLWGRREEFRKHIDAWEVASGKRIFNEVIEEKLPFIANSDFHQRNHMSSWKTAFNVEKNISSIFSNIKDQKLEVHYFEERVQNANHHSPDSLGNWISNSLWGNMVRA